MKGIIFNLLEDFICENWGDEKYEKIILLCPLKTKEPFVGPGTYPDSDLVSILQKSCEILNVETNEALHAFGVFSLPRLTARYPIFLEGIHSARDFLLIVNSVIHVEVKKLYPNASPPTFTYQDLSENQLIMTYQSERKLCALVEGFIQGVANLFNTKISIEQNKCTRKGDAHCEFELKFETP